MKIYLAASFSRQNEMRDVRDILESCGLTVTSRWLEEPYSLKGFGDAKFARQCAFTDLEDVRNADMLVRFSDDLSLRDVPSNLATGARMVEFGYALALGKPIVVVGGIQNVFDFLPQIIHIKDVTKLMEFLSPETVCIQ